MMLLLQVGGAVPNSTLELLRAASPVAQAVLVFLVLLSLLSWGIMFLKWRELRAVRSAGDAFMRGFEGSSSVEAVAALARTSSGSPYTRVFARATQFLTQTTPALAPTSDRAARLSGSQVEALRLVLDAETNHERDRLERFVPWLATIASVSPLIGLLGTVLGVISAFLGIATEGSGNIGAVAPGIAEALIATAAALAVAIPASFGYNLFATRLNRIDSSLEGFGSELIALMVREGRI
jgi:biopolymer transport protein TolQ